LGHRRSLGTSRVLSSIRSLVSVTVRVTVGPRYCLTSLARSDSSVAMKCLGTRPEDSGISDFADPCLATWRRRRDWRFYGALRASA
jgi:hypothetical protein